MSHITTEYIVIEQYIMNYYGKFYNFINEIFFMFKLLNVSILIVVLNIKPSFAEKQKIQINTGATFYSSEFLGQKNNLKSSNKVVVNLSTRYDLNNLSSQVALSFDGSNRLLLDGSYLQYVSGITTFGFGAIDRQWSFSDKTSLILSNNARPIKSVYLKLNNKFNK